MLKEYAFSVMALVLMACNSYGQFTLVGPEKSDPGNSVVITATEFKGNDIIVDCFPKNSYWTANKNLKGEPQVSFTTVNKGVYHFIFATNQDNKTIVKYWAVTIGQAPTPVVPVPDVPDSTPLSQRLDPVYMVSPNTAQLAKYASVISSVSSKIDNNTFTTYKQAWDVLISSTKSTLNSDTDLRSLRDEVAKYLVEKTGPSTLAYDKTKLSNAFKDLSTALEIIKKAHP